MTENILLLPIPACPWLWSYCLYECFCQLTDSIGSCLSQCFMIYNRILWSTGHPYAHADISFRKIWYINLYLDCYHHCYHWSHSLCSQDFLTLNVAYVWTEPDEKYAAPSASNSIQQDLKLITPRDFKQLLKTLGNKYLSWLLGLWYFVPFVLFYKLCFSIVWTGPSWAWHVRPVLCKETKHVNTLQSRLQLFQSHMPSSKHSPSGEASAEALLQHLQFKPHLPSKEGNYLL